jgi:protein-disulfide isomerase
MRRLFLPALLLLIPVTIAYAMAAETPKAPVKEAAPTAQAAELPERVLGDAAAKVTLIEYASLSCSHCAEFANLILPKLEEKYIKTGKVRLIYRDYPLDTVAMRAAKLAQCMPEERYFPFIKTLYSNQAGWLTTPKPEDTIDQYAKLAGMSAERVTSCLADKNIENAIVKTRMEADKKFQVRATPTIIVNNGDDRIEGARTFEDFEKALSKHVK